MAEFDGTAQTGRDLRTGARQLERHIPGGRVGSHAATAKSESTGPNRAERLPAPAGGIRQPWDARHAQRVFNHDLRVVHRRGARAADCVRQRGEPVAGAIRLAQRRDQRATRSRRGALASRATTAD